MDGSLDLGTAALAGLFSSAILYGILVVLFVHCLHALLRRGKAERPNYILVSATIAMLLLNTAIVALSFSRVRDAFLLDPADALDLGEWKEVTRTTLTCVYMVLADALLIYRCWIVWKKSLWVVAFPLVLLLACTAMSVILVRAMAEAQVDESIFAPALHPWITAVLSLTLFQNIIVTSLIVYRIWKLNSGVAGPGVRSLRPLISMILESGVIYVATLFIWLMTYVAYSNSEYIMVDCINPAIGITYYLLIIRVRTNGPSILSRNTGDRSAPATHQLQNISIEVHRHYHTDPHPGTESMSDFGITNAEDRKELSFLDDTHEAQV